MNDIPHKDQYADYTEWADSWEEISGDVEIGNRLARLNGADRACYLIFFLREKGPFAYHMIHAVQQTVYGLETEIGHADTVGVGIDQRDRDTSLPVLAYYACF